MTGASSLQHYVPQFLLRRFGTGKKRHVWVYDKLADRVFQSSSRRIVAERGRYDFEFNGVPVSQEASLATLEARAAALIKRIVEARNLSVLGEEDRGVLAAFLSVQLVRTNAAREQFRQIGKHLSEWVRESAGEDDEARKAAETFIGVQDDNSERMQLAAMLYTAPRDFGNALLSKEWALLETSHRHPFWIGDHPLAMFNHIDSGPRGNIGVAAQGIEIHLPLSPDLQLCLYCPTLVAELRQARGVIRQAEAMLASIESGAPSQLQPENVDHCNSLQVLHAERYLVSCAANFDMAREMIASDAAVRHGRGSQRS